MTETNVTMMFFLPPAKVHNLLESQMRRKNTYEICDALSELCSEYWELYGAIHTQVEKDDLDKYEEKIQSFFKFQAVTKVLKDWGWWDDKYNIPKDWGKEDK